jgi:hypothetical protein
MGNQNPYIEEEQTTQWPKEKVQNDKQRSTKHTDPGSFKLTDISYRLRFSFVSLACIVRSFFVRLSFVRVNTTLS